MHYSRDMPNTTIAESRFVEMLMHNPSKLPRAYLQKLSVWGKNKIQWAKMAAGILNDCVCTGPWHVQIDLTDECNNDCLACWCNSPLLGKGPTPRADRPSLSFPAVTALIDELSQMGVRVIYISGGGEPFMHPQIIDIIKYIKKKNIRLSMSTNFTLVDEKTIDGLVRCGIDEINISLWAASGKVYQKLHPNKSRETFHRITSMIDRLVEVKQARGEDYPKLVMYNVINQYNCSEVFPMLEYAFRHRLDAVHFAPVEVLNGITDCLGLRAEDKKSLRKTLEAAPDHVAEMEKIHGHRLKIENFDIFASRIMSRTNDDYDAAILGDMKACYAGWSFARILANGDVNPCLKSKNLPVGNIHRDSFRTIWFGTRQNEFRKYTHAFDIDSHFLRKIGSQSASQNQGCRKGCDNLKDNLDIATTLNGFGSLTRLSLRLVKLIYGRQ